MEYAIVIVTTPVMFAFSLLLRNKILMPIICSVPGVFGYVLGLRNALLSGFGAVLLWAVLQSVLVIVSSSRNPERMKGLILKSEAYTQLMFQWIQTGILPEGNAISVVWFHLKQTILYCTLAILTANIASLILGCILLNYMNFYVSHLASRSKERWRAVLLGWNFWSVVRVLAFVWLGVVLGVPLASKFIETETFHYYWIVPGIAGLIADLVFKLTLSNWWRKKLSSLFAETVQ